MTRDAVATTASPIDCPACAAHGTWHPGRQAVLCPACGTIVDGTAPTPLAGDGVDFLPLLRDRPDSGRDWRPGATQVRCAACAASMEYPAYLAGRACEACGSPSLLPCDATGAPVQPSGVAPFALSEGEARDRFAAWIDRTRSVGQRRRGFVIDRVRAVYVPCWTFSARVRIPWRGDIQRTNRAGESERVAIAGVVDKAWTDLLIPASVSLPADLFGRLEPFPTADLVAYDARYLAGYEVEVYGVNLWDAWDAADARIQGDVDRALRADADTSPTALETWPEWSGQRCRHVLLPVYAVDYTYRGDRYLALVNGRSGDIGGRLPVNRLAIAIALLVLLAAGAALVWLALVVLRWLF